MGWIKISRGPTKLTLFGSLLCYWAISHLAYPVIKIYHEDEAFSVPYFDEKSFSSLAMKVLEKRAYLVREFFSSCLHSSSSCFFGLFSALRPVGKGSFWFLPVSSDHPGF